MTVRQVGVIGSGVIGVGWALRFAMNGLRVFIYDSSEDALRSGSKHLTELANNLSNIGAIDTPEDVVARCNFVSNLDGEIRKADYFQECVFEDVDAKLAVFQYLDEIASQEVLLASSSSALDPAQIFEDVRGRERCLIAHPFNPPYLMPLVELVRSPWVSDDTVERTREFLTTVGQKPIVLHKAVPGFAANRLQAAVVNEGIALVEDGVLSPDDLDLCMTAALGLRWSFLGPFSTMDLNSSSGFLEYAAKFRSGYEALGRDLNVSRRWSEESLKRIEGQMRKHRPASQISDAIRRRDSSLIALQALIERKGRT
ncbi:MAG: 3-hydroxyacyl-CoA dehydrogenase NAD-binding domain-containing protein [Pseudomonadota bacterium]